MTKFTTGQRVTISDAEHPLFGKSGRVWRCLIRDNGAWVTMEEDIPDDMRHFPPEDPRANNVLLYPDQCSRAKAKVRP